MNLYSLVKSSCIILVCLFLSAVVLGDSLDFQLFKLKRELIRVEQNIVELKHQLTYIDKEHKKTVEIEIVERLIRKKKIKSLIKELESTIKTLEN